MPQAILMESLRRNRLLDRPLAVEQIMFMARSRARGSFHILNHIARNARR